MGTIHLQDRVPPANGISFLRAEWWDDSSRFVLVRYSRDGKEPELGLRLDLDKKIFLDHIEDSNSLDQAVQQRVNLIWQIVARERWGSTSPPSIRPVL
jgi:hypothetical protein